MDHSNQVLNDSPLLSNLTRPGRNASRIACRTAILIGASRPTEGDVGTTVSPFGLKRVNSLIAKLSKQTELSKPSKSSGRPISIYAIFVNRVRWPALTPMAWSSDSQRLVVGGADAQVWDAFGCTHMFTHIDISGSDACVEAVAWSPDGQFIASASMDNTMQVWSPG